MPQGVRTDSLEDPGPSGDTAHNPGSAVAIETAAGTIAEDRTAAAFPDGEIDSAGGSWGERDRDGLATLAVDGQTGVAAQEPGEGSEFGIDTTSGAQPGDYSVR